MIHKLKNLLLVVLSILLLITIFGCEGDDGEDGKVTLALNVSDNVTGGTIKIWVGIVTGLEDLSRRYPEGCIAGVGTTILKQSDLPDFYVLTPGVVYDHEPGTYEYVFYWEYYDNGDSYGYEGDYTIEINDGKKGTTKMLLFPEDGDDGDDNNYNLIFGMSSQSLAIAKTAPISAEMHKNIKEKMKIIKGLAKQQDNLIFDYIR